MAHRIDTATAQKDKFGVGKNGFTRGNPQTGVPATELDDDYFDMLQEEIVGIVEAAGDTLDKTQRNQLNTALGKLFQNKTVATSALGALVPAANRLPYFTGANGASLTELTPVGRDILASATKTAVLEYLGLGNFKYGAPMIGELVEWPRAEMPQEIWPDCGMEFIPYMGQSFDAVKYPLLSQLHPANVLPADMRGQVPRGWDSGRGIDAGRVLMSVQDDAIRNIVGEVRTGGAYSLFWTGNFESTGAFITDNIQTLVANTSVGSQAATRSLNFDASRVVPTAVENRVKNVAWNMIVRAK